MSLEDIYNQSSKPGIINARAQAAGQFSVNSVDPMNQIYMPGFVTRVPGDKRTWDKPTGENSNFTPAADKYYDVEVTSLGTDPVSQFSTEYIADATDTQFVVQNSSAPGTIYSYGSPNTT